MTQLQTSAGLPPPASPDAREPGGRDQFAAVYVDVVGSSALMSEDVAGTAERLHLLGQGLIHRLLRLYRGRLAGTAGDSFLLLFESPMRAARFAFALQERMAQQEAAEPKQAAIELRIGIECGRVVARGTELYGDCLNIAARLQSHSPPGGVCLSATMHRRIAGRLHVTFQPLGPLRLKNIARPVEAFLAKPAVWDAGGVSRPLQAGPSTVEILPASDAALQRHSIAVMRFATYGSAAEDTYVADGVVEDVVTALSLFRNLFVIGPSTSLRYRTGVDDPAQVGRDLGVRYVVEGSFRRAGKRLRTSARLVEASTGAQLWAERFDLDGFDAFALQDRITQKIVIAIEPTVLATEIERATRKPTENLDAYDHFLRAMQYRGQRSREALVEHHRLLAGAIRLDPGYAPALAMASLCYAINVDHAHGIAWLYDRRAGLELAQAAFTAGSNDATALALAAHARASLTEDFAGNVGSVDRALSLNANFAEGWIRSSIFRVALDDLDTAVEHARTGISLSPRDRYLWLAHIALGTALLFQDRPEDAIVSARAALAEPERPQWGYRILIAAMMRLGQPDEARAVAREFITHAPHFRIGEWRARNSFTRSHRFDFVEKSLRSVGVPG